MTSPPPRRTEQAVGQGARRRREWHDNDVVCFWIEERVWPLCCGVGEGAAEVGSCVDYRDSAAIRAWAANNGITVNARGRIPASLREQYEAAQSRA